MFPLMLLVGLTSATLNCDTLTGYYTGTFSSSQQEEDFGAQFEIEIKVDKQRSQIVGSFLKVNPVLTYPKIQLHFYGQDGNTWCNLTQACSADYPTTKDIFEVHVHKYFKSQDGTYVLFDVPFNPTTLDFTIDNEVGYCTKNQIDPGDWDFDPSKMSYCLCCGEYAPKSELDCPENTWQPTTLKSTATTSLKSTTLHTTTSLKSTVHTTKSLKSTLHTTKLPIQTTELKLTLHTTTSLKPTLHTTTSFKSTLHTTTSFKSTLHTTTSFKSTLHTTKLPIQTSTLNPISTVPTHASTNAPSTLILSTSTMQFPIQISTIKTKFPSTQKQTETTNIQTFKASTTSKPTTIFTTTKALQTFTTQATNHQTHPTTTGVKLSTNNKDQVQKIVNETIKAFEPKTADKAAVYQLSHIFQRIGSIDGIDKPDYDHVIKLYDKILDIDENVIWAANDQDSASSNRLLSGLDTLMSNNVYDLKIHKTNIGLQRTHKSDCRPGKYMGFADYGDSFGANNGTNYLASIEIPMSTLCDKDGNADPIYYAIYRAVNLFVPNSTDENSKLKHLNGNAVLEMAPGVFKKVSPDDFADKTPDGKLEPDKNPPKTSRCAVGYYQNKNRILTATIINNKDNNVQSKTMAVLRYKKEKIKESLHGNFKVSWWTGDEWSSDKTCAVKDSGDYYVAECNHLTDFTLLIDGAETDPILCDKALSTVGYVSNGGSIISLIILNVIYAFNFFSPLRDLLLTLFIAQPLLRFKVDILTSIYNCLLMLFFIFFTILNDQQRTGGNIVCQIVAGFDYWLLLCCIFLTIFQAWRILKIFAFNSRMEQLIIFITKPLVIIAASLSIPTLICIIAYLANHDFYNRKDNFCWINPKFVILAVVVPLTIMVVNGFVCLFIILIRMYPNARVFKPLSRLASVQSNMISQAKKNMAREKIITVLIMQFTLGIPWVIQYLTLFSPKATAWHYIFTIVIGTQGIVLLLLFIYKRFQAYQRQQLTTTTSGADTAFTNVRSTAQDPKSESEYDQVADSYAQPRRSESTIHRARQFVINKLSSNRRRPHESPPPIPPPAHTIPGRGLRRAD